MSKFILCKNQEKKARSVAFSTANGYKASGNYDGNNVSFACYHKLSIKNSNYLEIGDDFVSVIGTVIYKDTIGKESLHTIYNDYEGDVNVIRDNVLGNGAFIIKKGDVVTIFSEYLALYHVYYTFDGCSFVVSNELYDLLHLCKGLELDYENLVLDTLVSGTYGRDTVVKDVFCLQDNEKIVINTRTGDFSVEEVPVKWRSDENISYEETVSRIGDLLKEGAKSLVKHFGIPAISSTGGMDNRLNLATFLSIEIKPDLFYGIGNSYVTNTYDGDLTINKLYQEKLGLNLNIISWKNSSPINKDWNDSERKFGILSYKYAGSKEFNESYINIKNKLLLFGCFGEIYRIDDNTYLEDLKYSNYNLNQYIDLYPIDHYWNPYQKLFKDKDGIRKNIKEKLLPICRKWNLDPNNLTAKDDFILWMERLHKSDTSILNLMNRHHYCIFLNAQYKIVKLLADISPRDKSKARFQLDLIKYLYPKIMDVPIFSRCKFMHYDRKRGLMKPSFTNRIRHTVGKILRNANCYALIDVFYKFNKIFGRGKKAQDFEFDKDFEQLLKTKLEHYGLVDGVDFVTNYYNQIDRSLIRYLQLLEMFEHLGVKIPLGK